MKWVLTVAVALSLAAGSAASAQDRRGDGGQRGHRYERQERQDHGRGRGPGPGDYRQERGEGRGQGGWARGQRLPGAYRDSGVDYRSHRLRRPPRGYQWVQVGGDYVLTDAATGLILDVIRGDGY